LKQYGGEALEAGRNSKLELVSAIHGSLADQEAKFKSGKALLGEETMSGEHL
jgi:hypothetical protein